MRINRSITLFFILAFIVVFSLNHLALSAENSSGLIAQGAEVKKAASEEFGSPEGPAADADGNIYFSDIRAGNIWKWTWKDRKVSLYKEKMSEPNGLYFDGKGRLVICEMMNNRVILDDMKENITVLADSYKGSKLHMPNDLWVDPRGGIYFSDFLGMADHKEGLQVYYISPDYKTITRVTNDLDMPNGVIGTSDGKILYVADNNIVWSFDIQPDAGLTNKRHFNNEMSDGFTIDEKNNLYCTGKSITIYNPRGEKIDEITLSASNLTFGGKDRKTLFIASPMTKSIYTLEMAVKGAPTALDMAKGKK